MATRRARLLALIAALGTGAVLASAAAAPAGASTSRSTTLESTSTIKINNRNWTLPASIVQKISSGAPETMTPSEREQFAATVPSDLNDPGPVTYKASSPGGITPANVSRCNSSNVCIEVQSKGGSGPFLIEWNSQWYASSNTFDCDTTWDWWGDYSYYKESNTACGYGSDYSYWTPNRTFPTGGAETYYIGEDRGYSGATKFTIK